MARSKTNEWEFQGEVNSWLNEQIVARPGLGLDRSTQEPPIGTGRSDLVVWRARLAEAAFLTIELKTPGTAISDPALLDDACRKAQQRRAPYFAIWNMQAAELYPTPPSSRLAIPSDRIRVWAPDPNVVRVEDWLTARAKTTLRPRAIEILDAAWEHSTRARAAEQKIDATIFVGILAESLHQLRACLGPPLKSRTARDQDARRKLRDLAARQGFIGFVEDLEEAGKRSRGCRSHGRHRDEAAAPDLRSA